ncbi:MAG: serine/threonine-protein kinase [Polyangiales bacterium]
MTTPRQALGELLRLPEVPDAEGRRAGWRQALATLGGAVLDQRPAPLEGMPPQKIQAAIRVALESRLVDDIDFLSPPARAACLYELGTALPPGPEKRELGRRALRLLLEGDAPTFAMLATLLALGSSRALTGPAIQARVALCLDLPIGAGARADALALALISRRETVREWLTEPSMGSLPSRRLAARLLERAAREAQRRCALGEYAAPRVFKAPEVKSVWSRLLADREPLVWRHVATARGLLTAANEDLAVEVHRQTDPTLSPTEWRRAATSIAASIAVDPEGAVRTANQLLRSPIFAKDRGVAASLALGLPRAAEAEPAAVEKVLGPLLAKGDVDTFEALADIRHERIHETFDATVFHTACDRLADILRTDTGLDDGQTALIEALRDELSGDRTSGELSLVHRIDGAMMRYASEGAHAAFDEARSTLALVRDMVDRIERAKESSADDRKGAFRALREIDMALLEKSTLNSLLRLDSTKSEASRATLNESTSRVTEWLFDRESEPVTADAPVEHFVYRMRRVRTWLHLVDADIGRNGENAEMAREKRLESARRLLVRVRDDEDSKLDRVVRAACSRACDALVREEIFEVSDVLVLATLYAREGRAILTFAEASVVPEIKQSLESYSALRRVIDESPPTEGGRDAVLKTFLEFVNALPISSTPRLEALRQTLLAIHQALDAITQARSLASLRKAGAGSSLTELEIGLDHLTQLVAGATRRLGIEPPHTDPLTPAAIRGLDFAAERAANGTTGAKADLDAAIDGLAGCFKDELPPFVGAATAFVLEHLRGLPAEEPEGSRARPSELPTKAAPLPPWLPPGRTLGSFYVLRVLGTGAVGSVFVATRIEDRYKREPQRFALKVPDYAGAAARELSEREFHAVFRQEAGALLSLPDHPNLARLVTFDAGAQPKPILVMELVEGPSLERVLRLRNMDIDHAFELLDGAAAGLDGMHAAGIGHLDVKPSNVILREQQIGSLESPAHGPVLVDFGLAGRNIRPGCATSAYGAPEVWGTLGRGTKLRPMPADVYAFGCLVYEVLTGTTLFTGPSEIALVTSHISHDGNPPPITALASDPKLGTLVTLLTSMLRHKPDDRATISEVRARMKDVHTDLRGAAWPLVRPS